VYLDAEPELHIAPVHRRSASFDADDEIGGGRLCRLTGATGSNGGISSRNGIGRTARTESRRS
jgi:hypothetical protein